MTNRDLLIKQKKLLDTFLEHHTITKTQYDKSLGDLILKMGVKDVPLEIERKYLIEYPEINRIRCMEGTQEVEITQYYFDTEEEKKLRLRTWKENGRVKYILTRKTHITDMTRIEEESEISREEYENLIERAKSFGEDANMRSIAKTRFRFPYGGKTVEVDIYPFWSDQAIAEVELENEAEEVSLPPELKVIREVTEDKYYTNYNLAEIYSQQ